MELIEEDLPEFDEQEEILQQLEIIIRHEENLLRSGKTLRWYLVKFRNYPLKDARRMQES